MDVAVSRRNFRCDLQSHSGWDTNIGSKAESRSAGRFRTDHRQGFGERPATALSERGGNANGFAAAETGHQFGTLACTVLRRRRRGTGKRRIAAGNIAGVTNSHKAKRLLCRGWISSAGGCRSSLSPLSIVSQQSSPEQRMVAAHFLYRLRRLSRSVSVRPNARLHPGKKVVLPPGTT